MNHPTEEQLILYHYGEVEGRDRIASHLEACASCRANYQALQRVLEAVNTMPVPQRTQGYGAEVWRQLRPQIVQATALRRLDFWQLFQWPRWAVAGALASLVLIAFLAGRFWPQRDSTAEPLIAKSPQPISRQARERVLLKEIGDHLERSQLALIELINSKTNGVVDISLEQSLARQLVDVNRLYRQSAARLGDAGMASVLEDLERTLLEIAHSSSRPEAGELDEILFKVRATGLQLRVREQQTQIVGRPSGRTGL